MSGCLSVCLDYIHNFQSSLYNFMIFFSIKKKPQRACSDFVRGGVSDLRGRGLLGGGDATFFFAVAHLLIKTKLFCFIKISYLQPFREIMGGQDSVTTTTNNEQQTTNNKHHGRS
jgi:hypothetical protein